MAELRRVRQSCEARRSRAHVDVFRSENVLIVAARDDSRVASRGVRINFSLPILSLSSAMILLRSWNADYELEAANIKTDRQRSLTRGCRSFRVPAKKGTRGWSRYWNDSCCSGFYFSQKSIQEIPRDEGNRGLGRTENLGQPQRLEENCSIKTRLEQSTNSLLL